MDPTNSELFPFLSRIAVGFEQYELLGLVFTYQSESGFNTTSVGQGSVNLAFDYDPANPDPTSLIEVRNMYGARIARPTENIMLPVECQRSQTFEPIKFVRQPYGSDTDTRLTTFGKLIVATEGNPDNSVMGTLSVTYNIRLLKPLIRSNLTGAEYYVYANDRTNTTLFSEGSATL